MLFSSNKSTNFVELFTLLILITYSLKKHFNMAYVISDSCVACGTCQSVCPADAIKEGDIYSIDPDTCLDCGTCADACPTGAIAPGE
jgi:NAD-dependent dihydropyrimidine dehydrogenase PreA subunit